MTTRSALALTAVVAALATPQARQAPQPQPGPPQLSFKSTTTVIEVDVIVRDKDRRFVADLRASDFDVFEEGVQQQISAIYRVIGPNEPGAAGTAGDASIPAPPPQLAQRVLILYFDQAHIQPGGFDRAKKAALEFLKKDFRAGDVGGVVNGSTMVNKRLTSSREELEAAVAAVTPAPETSTVTRELRQWPRFRDLNEAFRVTRREPSYQGGTGTALDEVVRRACAEQPSSCERGGTTLVEAETESKATQLVSQARLLGKQTMDTVTGLASGLARLPGRKTIIMLTEGFFVEDSWADLRAVVGRAARASVRIYAIDARGLNRGSAGSDILVSASPSVDGATVGDSGADGPNSLAVDTGGYVIRNENDFGKAFTEIDRDTSSYYVIGFRTSRPLDGKFHTIDVKIRRPGVTVRARKGYLASPDLAKPSVAPPSPLADAAGGLPAGLEKAAPVAAERSALAAPTPEALPAPATVVTSPAPPDPAGPRRLRPNMTEEVAALEPKTATAAGSAPFPASLMKKAREGWDAYQRGSVAEAQTALEPAAAHPAAPPWVLYVLGWTQFAQAHATAASESWERVRGEVPEFSAVYFDLADAYLQQREFGRAVDVLRAAEKRWPRDVDVYNALGVVQLARGAVDDAVGSFEKAVGVGPADVTAAYNLARTSEMRFVRGSRLSRTGPGSVSPASLVQDRDRAVEYYRRTIALGGPFVEQAKEGLKRLGVQKETPEASA
jgi:VWFA-related protein